MITAAAVVVLAAAGGYLGVTRTYALEYGSTFSWGNGVRADDRSAAVYPLAPGERANVAISIRNPGSFPVTLDGVSSATSNLVVEDAAVVVNAMSTPNWPQQAEPFHAVEIGAGDEATVWLTLRPTGASPFDPCTSFALVSADVDYRILGVHRSQSITLPMALSFQKACEQAT